MIEFFRIMPGRYNDLQNTINGYHLTGAPLISHSQEGGITPIAIGDDMGSFYIIPKIVDIFGISLDLAIQLLYSGSVVAAFIVGSIGSWLYCKTKIGKYITVTLFAIISIIIAAVGDLYVFLGASVIALIPWWLIVHRNNNIKKQLLYCILAGLLIGAIDLIRSYSGASVFIFIFTSIVMSKSIVNKYKFALIFSMTVSLSIFPIIFNSTVLSDQKTYLENSGNSVSKAVKNHPFWHNVYLSLGFLNNPYGIVTSDSNSVYKVQSINPNAPLHSLEYENILKNETLKIVVNHPFFIFQTLSAKLGIIIIYIIIFTNIGLFFSVRYRKGYRFDTPFISSAGFNSLFGVLTTPEYQYLLGLFAVCVVFSAYSIDFAIYNKTCVKKSC